MRPRLRDIVGVIAFAILIAASVRGAVWFWDPADPGPGRATLIIVGYCVALLAALLTFVLVVQRMNRQDPPEQSGGGGLPAEPSPAGVPNPPRRPKPLVAHAKPPPSED